MKTQSSPRPSTTGALTAETVPSAIVVSMRKLADGVVPFVAQRSTHLMKSSVSPGGAR